LFIDVVVVRRQTCVLFRPASVHQLVVVFAWQCCSRAKQFQPLRRRRSRVCRRLWWPLRCNFRPHHPVSSFARPTAPVLGTPVYELTSNSYTNEPVIYNAA